MHHCNDSMKAVLYSLYNISKCTTKDTTTIMPNILVIQACMHDRMCIPLRQQDAGSSTFVVHFPDRALVVVTDPTAIKEIAMQPKNEKTRSFLSIFSTLFGER